MSEGLSHLEERDQLVGDWGFKSVAYTKTDTHRISTMWVGVDLRLDRTQGQPLIFETMVFFNGDDVYTARCATEEEALAQHQVAVEKFVMKVKIEK